jgi:hypothetical protein
MNRQFTLWYLTIVLLLSLLSYAFALPPKERPATQTTSQTVDNETYLDANKILMFVTNHGNFGRDLSGTFGFDYGTFFPFTGVADIISDANTSSPLYAGGLWLGGVDSASGDTLVVVSEYSSEYVPGPMSGGTYQTDRPEFHVYKLYRDSLADNPNNDYRNWPVDQGAPVDGDGHPIMLGDQMTWTVFNDANPVYHYNNSGETAPLGIEVQHTVWASDQDGDMELYIGSPYTVSGPNTSILTVTAACANAGQVNGHDYAVVTDSTADEGFCWHLIDLTESDTVLARQTDFSGQEIVVDGIDLKVTMGGAFNSFEMVANASGPIDPPAPGAAAFAGFPTPNMDDPTASQQAGGARWLFTTGDNGGTSGGGTRGTYTAFLIRSLRVNDDGGARLTRLGNYDYEMRFTGSNDNPGTGGGYAWATPYFSLSGEGYWIPFELWRTGIDTPDDPTDDLRLIPWIYGDLTGDGSGDNFVYDLSQYGSSADGTCHSGCEHSISSGDNDPYTDWVYWRLPENQTFGDAGYKAFEEAMISDPQNWPGNELAIMDRTVLVEWNGGIQPPFIQDLPETGTVFRLRTTKHTLGVTHTFTATVPQTITTGPLGTTVFMKYKLINKGNRALHDFFASLWLDPDLGQSGDDLVGCIPNANAFFCYNGQAGDTKFAGPPPVIGFKLIEGPIIPSEGAIAWVDGKEVPDHANLELYSFVMYINNLDPSNYAESYQFMQGLDAKNDGIPYVDPTTGEETRFMLSGDPISGTGWIDDTPADRRMMASVGPFDFRPGDTQQVVFKMSVGQGENFTQSFVAMVDCLNANNTPTGAEGEETLALPTEFRVRQNYPNPFNPSTIISYALPERANVEVTIFNILGQKVTTLIRKSQPAGEYTAVWNGVDVSGQPVASGIYFYRVQAGENVQTRKMMLLK